MLNVQMPSYYTKPHYAESSNAKYLMLSVIVLNVIMPSTIILIVHMLSVIMLTVQMPSILSQCV